jgi:hypothetical protein
MKATIKTTGESVSIIGAGWRSNSEYAYRVQPVGRGAEWIPAREVTVEPGASETVMAFAVQCNPVYQWVHFFNGRYHR